MKSMNQTTSFIININFWFITFTCFDNLEEEKIIKTYKNALENRDIKKEEDFCNTFLNIRKDLVQNNYDFWQTLEVPYDFFHEIKKLYRQIDIVIASKKNKPSIITRLKSYGLNIDENHVFAREILDKYSTKAEFMAEYMEKNNYSEALFIDDNSNNLNPCKNYPQIKTLLALWGNIAPGEQGVNQQEALLEIKKFFNIL